MINKENAGIVVVPHKNDNPRLEAEISGIPQWKQDVFKLVAELTKYRLKSRMTQKELAEKLKVSQSVIARFEKLGRYPTIEFLYKVAEGLGVSINIATNVLPQTPIVKEQISSCITSRRTGVPEIWSNYTRDNIVILSGRQDKLDMRLTITNEQVCFNNGVYKEPQKTIISDEFVKCDEQKVQILTNKQESKLPSSLMPLAA